MSRVRMEWDWPPPRRRPSPEWQEEENTTEEVETPSRGWRHQPRTKWTGPSPRAMKVFGLFFRFYWFLIKAFIAAACGIVLVGLVAMLWIIFTTAAPAQERGHWSKPMASNEVPPNELPIVAVAHIFQLKFFAKPHMIQLISPSIAMIDGISIEPIKPSSCTFRLRKVDGTIAASINFNRLSDEYRVIPLYADFGNLVVSGFSGAVCQAVSFSPGGQPEGPKCFPFLLIHGTTALINNALRTLRYIFSNVCQPAQIPF